MENEISGPGVIDEILSLYAERGHEHYDEAVSQTAHATQCAHLAVEAGASDALVAAALLHDIGHLLSPEGPERHESMGSRFLARHFPPSVTAPVALHVGAKRFLCSIDAAYRETLSAASVHSLELQGGPMQQQEADSFRSRKGWRDAVELRRWDDLAKVPGREVASLEDYRGLLVKITALNPRRHRSSDPAGAGRPGGR